MAITMNRLKNYAKPPVRVFWIAAKRWNKPDGDFDKAVDFLREKGLATAAKRADRDAIRRHG